jgi:thiol-disulfide isomerase/thioredoxin
MTRTRVPLPVAAALAALCLAACGSSAPPSEGTGPASADALPQLKADANRIFDGGVDAFRRRLGALRGHPVVVNQWASWCGPCRFEFPFFQKLAERYDGRVAFLGVDSQDERKSAAKFLREYPVPYPHYYDPDAKVARVFRGGQSWPTTAFYDASGKLAFTHIGGYASLDKLEQEIREHALG